MTTQNDPETYADGIDISDKIMDSDSRAEWRRLINRALMEEAARRAAKIRIDELGESFLDRILSMAGFPPPLSSETLMALVPDERSVQWADLASTLRDLYHLSTYEVGDHIRRAVKRGMLYVDEQQGLKYLSRVNMTDGIDWPRMTDHRRAKGPDVVAKLTEHLACSDSKAYQLIEAAVTKGVLGEQKKGRTRLLWVKRRDVTRRDPISEPVPAVPVSEPGDGSFPVQNHDGLLPPPAPDHPPEFAAWWSENMATLGRFDAYDPDRRDERKAIIKKWGRANQAFVDANQ
jgi:hypothetical protein